MLLNLNVNYALINDTDQFEHQLNSMMKYLSLKFERTQ